eukprot:549605-Pelagomonas_calceolata.AAC.1
MQAAELEEFLFGAKSSSARIFERAEPEEEDDMTLADLLHKVGAQHGGCFDKFCVQHHSSHPPNILHLTCPGLRCC